MAGFLLCVCVCVCACVCACVRACMRACTCVPAGECYLMEWSEWNPCVSVCAKEAGVDFGSVQVRVRPVMAQEPQNLQLCPDQAWESRPCTGTPVLVNTPGTGTPVLDNTPGTGTPVLVNTREQIVLQGPATGNQRETIPVHRPSLRLTGLILPTEGDLGRVLRVQLTRVDCPLAGADELSQLNGR